MSDPVFAAEMASLEAARRTAERARRGDGMAATSHGWMDFSGERVPVPAPREDFDPATQSLWSSIAHRHAPGSDCLEPVRGGIRLVPNGDDPEIPEAGWFRCTEGWRGHRVHVHGDRLFAHFSGDKRACPDGVQP